MSDVTIAQFADTLKIPVEKLLKQLEEAGIGGRGSDDVITDDAKKELLKHLRLSYGQDKVGAGGAGIRNCRFAYKCDKIWDSLRTTADSSVRFCDECQRHVYWCSTEAELATHVVHNRCVAIEVNDILRHRRQVFIGEPARE
jgi:hypothetical protein